MKRDMDLARKILKIVEDDSNPNRFTSLTPLEEEGYNCEQIAYHVRLLAEAGLVEAIDTSTLQGMSYEVRNLTWQGHDFLDASRDDTIWKKAKEIVLEKTGGLAFDTLKATLIDLGKNTVKDITRTYFQ